MDKDTLQSPRDEEPQEDTFMSGFVCTYLGLRVEDLCLGLGFGSEALGIRAQASAPGVRGFCARARNIPKGGFSLVILA